MIVLYVDKDIYDRLNRRLEHMPDKIPDTLKKTINNTAKKAEKNLKTEIRKQYTLKSASKRLNEAVSVENALNKSPLVTIEVKGGFIPLYYFQKRKNGKRVAAKARVLTGSPMKELRLKGADANGKDLKAFITTVKYRGKGGNNGEHVGIFQRLPASEAGSKDKRKIKQLYGPPIPEMAGNKKVLSVVIDGINSDLRESLKKHIAKAVEEI